MNSLRLLRSIQKQSIFKIHTAKYASQYPLRFHETQDRWREKDGVSRRWQLIYKAPMESLLNYATAYLTFSTASVTCLGTYYAAFVFDKAEMDNPFIIGDDVVIANSSLECFAYLGAFVLFHAAVKILLSKYVLRLYQDGDNYIAVFRGHMFNSIRKHEFHLKDFKKRSPNMIITWSEARYDLGKRHGIILENYFKTPQYFNYLLYKKKFNETSDE